MVNKLTWNKLTDAQKRRLVEVLLRKIERLESIAHDLPGKPRRIKKRNGEVALDRNAKALDSSIGLSQMYSGQLD
ncbi:hypothetical protein [Nostoc sp. 2RC]|uniref:hypothetical protein n=1 Tax=Nostoc sp. 2RC TaxID=2485484 RepID=UPI001623A657|nr:hypothetical protein [Nostoc sp. 2RC]MBC1236295.1 hypothetical protein [Nostoc sp. 2RC]